MEEYLGVKPQNDSEGLMQDIHWYAGLIGYFPSYAIGNAYSVQIYNTMKKDIDISQILKNKEIYKIRKWLEEKIHRYGKLKDTSVLIKELTGEELNAINQQYRYNSGNNVLTMTGEGGGTGSFSSTIENTSREFDKLFDDYNIVNTRITVLHNDYTIDAPMFGRSSNDSSIFYCEFFM